MAKKAATTTDQNDFVKALIAKMTDPSAVLTDAEQAIVSSLAEGIDEKQRIENEKHREESGEAYAKKISDLDVEIELREGRIESWKQGEIKKIREMAVDKIVDQVTPLRTDRKETITAARKDGFDFFADKRRTTNGYIGDHWTIVLDKTNREIEFRLDGAKKARCKMVDWDKGKETAIGDVLSQIALDREGNGKKPWGESHDGQHRRTFTKMVDELIASETATA